MYFIRIEKIKSSLTNEIRIWVSWCFILEYLLGSMTDEFTNHKGYIEVNNLSEENDPEDLDVSLFYIF